MTELTLIRKQDRLADPAEQLRLLDSLPQVPEFSRTLASRNLPQLQATSIEVLQVNVGKICNQTCRHCHVDAGPDRRESMSRNVAEACLRVLTMGHIPILDITGGAPEMNSHFRWLVSQARTLGHRVIDRCNLTILVAAGFEDLPEFLAANNVEIVASLPLLPGRKCRPAAGAIRFRKVLGGAEAIERTRLWHGRFFAAIDAGI